MQGAYRLGGGFPDSVLQGLDLAAKDGQGGSQFVGDVCDPLPSRLLVLFERQGKGVEVPGETAQFVGGLHGNAGVVSSGRQTVRGRRHTTDPFDHPFGEGNGQQGRQKDHRQSNEGEGLLLFPGKVHLAGVR